MTRRGFGLDTWAFAALTILVAGLGFVSFGRRVSEAEPYLGVEWIGARHGVVALSVDADGPAGRSGLLPGDRLVSADGTRVAHPLVGAELPWVLPQNRPSVLEIDRGGDVLRLEIEPVYRHAMPSIYGYLALVGAACLASGAFIALRWPGMRGSRLYGLLGVSLAATFIFSQTGRADLGDWLVHAGDLAAGCVAPALLIHLAVVLARRTVPARRVWVAMAWAPAVFLLMVAVWMEGLGGAYRFERPEAAITAIDRAQLAFLAVAVVVACAVLGRSYARSSSGMHRGQVRWMLWGLALGLGPFVTIYGLPWAFGAAIPSWADLTVLPVLLVPAAFTAAMARYRLNDLDLVLRGGLATAALAFVVVATYAASLIVLRRLVDPRAFPRDVLSFLAALIVALAYPKLRQWVRAGVDRAFYRARYSYRATLLDWSRELNAETDLETLLQRLRERVCETLAVPDATVLVRAGPQTFEEVGHQSASLIVEMPKSLHEALERDGSLSSEAPVLAALPSMRHVFGMRVKGRLSAVLAVAERQDPDQPLTSEDRALLATLCAHAAAAIEAARLMREVRQHADQVENLKARQERILESSGVGFLLVDAHARVLAWNRALEAMYGLGRDEAIGCKMGDVFPLHTVRALERGASAAGPGDEARIYGHTLVNRRGQRIVVNVTVSPVVSQEPGGDEARVVTFDDVTERIRLEEQVLRQERLASLGLLAAGVAHEVNTPLTGISSYSQMLLEDLATDDPRRPILERIEAQSRRASSIANSLLNLARPTPSELQPTDVNETVREVVRLFEPQIRGRGVALEVRLDPGLPRVRGDAGKLQQVLLNLLLNARDAVGDGGTVTVMTSMRAGRIVLDVSDDGVGIAEEDLPRIFDPFFTTKGRGKGTGLGLSVSYGIVREHDGEMHVESVPGQLTRFRVELPAVAARRASADSVS